MLTPQDILNEIRLRQAAAEQAKNRSLHAQEQLICHVEANVLEELGDWLEEQIEEDEDYDG